MILIIGGFAQGKLHYVEQHYVQREDRQEVPVLDGTLRLASDSKMTWATESAFENNAWKADRAAYRAADGWTAGDRQSSAPIYTGAVATGNRSGRQ